VARLIVGRLLAALPILALVATLVFFLAELGDTDPASVMLGLDASPSALAAKRAELGIDRPVLARYADWIGDAARGDLGTNWFNGEPVTTELAGRLRVTLATTLGGLAVAASIGVAAGVFAALRSGRWADRVITVAASLGIALPNFWVALLLAYVVGVRWRLLPAVWPAGGPTSLAGWFEALLLPSLALGCAAAAAIARQTRSSVIGVIQREHIRTALAKGLSVRQVVGRHVLRNAAIPVVTLMGFQVSALLGGSVFVEAVFNIPGLGMYGVDAILRGNTPALLGFVLVTALAVVVVNLVLDIAYAWLNPKVRVA